MAQAPVQRTGKVAKTLEMLSSGSVLVKVRKKGKQYPRHYRMESDFLCFQQLDTRKITVLRKMARMDTDKIKVWLKEIQDVRIGPYSDVFAKHFDDLGVKENQCFSLVYGNKHKSLDFIAESGEVAEQWVKGLKHLIKKINQADLITQQEIWMREMFQYADKNKDETLSLKEVVSLLKHLNIEVDHDQARTVFEAADTNKNPNQKGESVLDLEEFISFYQMITRRPEVEELFTKYNCEGDYLDTGELKDFLTQEQAFEVSIEDCEKYIQQYEPCPNVKEQKMMSPDGFNALINSSLMNVFNIAHSEVYQDMHRPLSDYWIDSSHNTYLTADQLVGPSAVESYIRALKRGCRCVELDCWDGDKEPVVYHGHTLTSKISFKDVISCISLYAFETSQYPLILSIENHCSVEQQKKMSDNMRSILGDQLLCDTDIASDVLPSPASLKNKILVKGKKLKKKLTDSEDDDDVSDEDEAADLEDENVKEQAKTKKAGHSVKLAQELSDCVVLCQSVSFKGYDYAINNYNCLQMSSLGESKAEGMAEDSNLDFLKHNAWQLSRIYPSGRRTDSSNYDAVPLWNAGCQIVALNYQTPDEEMMIYKAKFRDNGGCGFVLKPEYMRRENHHTNDLMKMSNGKIFNKDAVVPKDWKKKLSIKIISGYQLPKKKGDKAKSILDPYVQIDIQGVPDDVASQKTKTIHNNGFNPVWSEDVAFDITVPDLAIVWFRVMDYESYGRNELVAQYSLPFTSLMQGFRTVHLRTKYGDPIFGCTLFVNVNIT